MNKLLFSLPKPSAITVVDNTRNYTKKPWPIRTFLTQENKHVNYAIAYYYQKMMVFVNRANSQLQQNLNQWYGVQTIQEVFEQAADAYDKKFASVWAAIQNTSTKDLQANVNRLNNYTQQLMLTGQKTISFASILSMLTNGTIGSAQTNNIPGTININQIQTYLSSLASSYEYGTPQQIGAHRALAFGQIYESGVNSMLAANMKHLLNYFGTGHQRTMKTLTANAAGKTDGLFTITGVNYDLSQISPILSGTLSDSGQAKNIILEEYGDIDLSNGGFHQAIMKYASNPTAAGMIGIQNKAWIKPSGTMGSYALSAAEITARVGDISDWFANDGRFANYTGYVVSKYLINIIGAHNALMATGAHGFTSTYLWLYNLYTSGKHIRHSFNLMQSVDRIRKDHTREMLAKNERGFHDAAIYQVRNNIIIANYKPA